MNKTLGVSKITKNYQVSIPPDVRELLTVSVGDYVVFEKKEELVIVRKV